MSTAGLSKDALVERTESLRRWTLLILVGGVPLFFLRFTNDPFEIAKLGLLSAGVSLAAALRFIEYLQGATAERLRRLWVPSACILVPLSIAWAFSPYRYWSLLGEYKRFQGLVPYLLVVLLGVLIADAFDGRRRDLAFAFVVAGAIAGIYAVLQFVGIDPFEWGTTAGGQTHRTSTLGNPNFTGGYLAVTLPVALALWRDGGPRANLAAQGSVAILAGQIVSFSQGGYASTIAGVALAAGIVWRPRWRFAKQAGVAVAAAAAALTIGVVLLAMARPEMEKLPQSIQQRALWWQGAVSMGLDNPLVGRGPNSYAVDGARYRPVRDSVVHGIDISDDVHSVPLSLFAAAGLPGLLGFIGLAAWALIRILRIEPEDVLSAGFGGAIGAYLTQSLVSIDQMSLRAGLWAALGGLVCARSGAMTRSPSKKRPSRSRPVPIKSPAVVALAAIVGLTGAWWGGAFVLNDARVWEGTVAFTSRDPAEGMNLFEKAIDFRDDYRYRHILGVYLGATAQEKKEDQERWISEMQQAFAYLDHFPSVFGLRDHAKILTQLDEERPELRDEAADIYVRALSLDPYNSTLHGEAAPVLTDQDRDQALIDVLAPRIDRLQEMNPGLWAYLAIAYENVGEHDDAVRALKRAEQLAPGSTELGLARAVVE